jgi:uncharacterized membrane protein YqjE
MPEADPSPLGFVQAFRRLLETFVAILESRLELASVELREEKARVLLLLALAGVALFGVAMAVIVLTTLVIVLCWAYAAWVLGGFAILYAVLALLGYQALRRELRKPFFDDTIAQLKKDREWLIPRH